MSNSVQNFKDNFERNFFAAVKHLPESGIIDLIRSVELPPGQAFKIRKINAAKSHELDRSICLTRSLVVLSNGTLFYTGKRKDWRQGVYYPSVPGGSDGKILGSGAFKLALRVFDLNSEKFKAIAIPISKITKVVFLPSMKNEELMGRRVQSMYVLPARYFSGTTISGKEIGYLESECCIMSLKQMLIQDPKFLAKHPEIVNQVREALEACHRAGIAHLDAKMDNIFITKTAEGQFIAKLADFGSAREILEDPYGLDNDLEEDDSYLEVLKKAYFMSCRA